MLEIIVHAAENFLSHQLGIKGVVSGNAGNMRTIIAYIDIEIALQQTSRVYIACSESMAEHIAEEMLGEAENDEDTLVDMVLETANLIVGSAKVLGQEAGVVFTIRTPHFVKRGIFDMECDVQNVIGSDDRTIILGIKELETHG